MFAVNAFTIRLAGDDDAEPLRRLAEVDSQNPLSGRILVAVDGDEVVAARARRADQANATDLTLASESGGTAEAQVQSSGAAWSSPPREQIAHTLPSGAPTNDSTMSGIGTSMPSAAGSHVSPPSRDTTMRPPRPTRSAGPATTSSGRAGGTIVARV
jgi:hypothetical protein